MRDTSRSVAHEARGRIGITWGILVDADGCLEILEANERGLLKRGEFARAREYRRMIERYALQWTTRN